MTLRTFINTNILVYAEAVDAPVKQRMALNLLKRLFLESSGVLSTQVLQEYCNVALRKLRCTAEHVRAQLQVYEQFEVVQVTPTLIRSAVELHQLRRFSFYDALALTTAQAAGCGEFVSEDLTAGELVNGVRVVNPFAGHASAPLAGE